jgi:hypothetical protein
LKQPIQVPPQLFQDFLALPDLDAGLRATIPAVSVNRQLAIDLE